MEGNCRRADRDPTAQDRLCSCHFVDGKKENGPSVFYHNTSTRFTFASPEKRRTVKKRETPREVTEPPPTLQLSDSSRTDAATSAEVYFLRQENARLSELLKKGEIRLTFSSIKESDSLIFQYTGLPSAAEFGIIMTTMQRFRFNYYMGWKVGSLYFADQLLCALMKLRLNLQYFDIAYRFKISSTTVQNIVLTFIYVIHRIFFQGMMQSMPSRKKNAPGNSACFATFPNTRVVLDCTVNEVPIPSSMKLQKAVFSQYKQRHTLGLLLMPPLPM